jgi:hypothetical protein
LRRRHAGQKSRQTVPSGGSAGDQKWFLLDTIAIGNVWPDGAGARRLMFATNGNFLPSPVP